MKWHVSKPDIDKLLRAVLDPLTGIVMVDDSRVAYVTASKRYAIDGEPTGAMISLCTLAEGD
jgi:Holliday junction resolvase RusA-like endonuclease